jgi:uncharacterized protein (TIGR03437 family)
LSQVQAFGPRGECCEYSRIIVVNPRVCLSRGLYWMGAIVVALPSGRGSEWGVVVRSFAVIFFFALAAHASETDALAISVNIQAKHLPFGTILDPLYESSSSNQIAGYTRCGDSALWTGAYLAAEAFRYNVTRSAAALANVKAALAGLQGLLDVTGDNRLARCMVLAKSPYAAGISSEEASNTIHQSPPWIWVDNTSRDQVVGAFFGLGAAFDLVDDATVKSGISSLATLMLGFIAHHQWSPNDDISNTFLLRPEELQMLLQVQHHVNPVDQIGGPLLNLPIDVSVSFDTLSISSYYKFNLDYMSFYNLIRLQNNGDNRGAYQIVRDYTASHQNAFFDIIDRSVNGPDDARDAEMRLLLDQWLERPRRDPYVDNSKTVPVCGTEACNPVPVPLRPPTDFLWQRDPFQLAGGGTGFIEGAGIDYILPYWMGRYYGVISGTVQSAAAPSDAVAPGSLASLFGTNLAAITLEAGGQPLPTMLGGVSLSVTDSAGAVRQAPLLYVSPTQINFVVPDGTAIGSAQFAVTNGSTTQTFTGTVASIDPTLFSVGGSVAAASAIRTQANDSKLQSPVPVFQCSASGCVAVPIDLGVDTPIYLTLYGTGIRGRSALANVTVTIGGIAVPVLYAGQTPNFVGLDQVNVPLVLGLRGSGLCSVVVTVDGQASNAVMIDIQ